MKVIIIVLTICNISFFLFGMEEEKPIKIWNPDEIQIFFPTRGYQKNKNKKCCNVYKGFFLKEQNYYVIETFINDQKCKACLQLNDYQKEFVEKNEYTMTILLKSLNDNIQIDIEKINDKECKKLEISDKIDKHFLSVDERLAIGDEGDIPKYLNILTLYSNKIYFTEGAYCMSIYKQNYYNVIETFGEGNKVYILPFSLEMIMRLEERNQSFYLHLNEETDKGNNLKVLIRIAQINDKTLSMNQKKQEEEYLENDHYLLSDVLSEKTDSEKINYIESLVFDLHNFLDKKNKQEVERGDYSSDSRSEQDITNNQEITVELQKYTDTITEKLTIFTENIIKENEQLKTQLNTMQNKFSTIVNQNNKILQKIHYMMYGVSFWIIVLLMYYTYKNHRVLIFT